jgi:peptidoglycan hydrolase-like protein with peptidoglycan-binding domain
MTLASKVVCAGIAVLLLLTMGISGARPTPVTSRPDLTNEVPPVADTNNTSTNNTSKMQQILQDEGHYRGKVDGVVGLRTRASIRGFQKVENLPVTGELDVQTAGKLGVRPEVREAKGYETPLDKPSAGVKLSDRSRRRSNTPRMPVRKLASTVPPS